jgi:hypothetical protein
MLIGRGEGCLWPASDGRAEDRLAGSRLSKATGSLKVGSRMLADRFESTRKGIEPRSAGADALTKGGAVEGADLDEGPAERTRKGMPACDSTKATKSCSACVSEASSPVRTRSQAASGRARRRRNQRTSTRRWSCQ